MTFYVIGNGFDIHYNLQTRYSDFKDYLLTQSHQELISKIDSLFFNSNKYSSNDIKTWSQFEDMLTVFNDLNAEEIFDESMENAESDYSRASYWDSPSWNVSYYNDYIEVLKKEFLSWVKSISTNIIIDNYFDPESDDYILTFNYTTTIEDNFNIKPDNVLHIHGKIGEEIILGHNQFQSPDSFVINENEDSDYRETSTKKAVNNILKLASIIYYKNSSYLIHKYNEVFTTIANYDKVVIMGLSCGKQDEIYIKEIIKHAKQIVFYYHCDNDIRRFQSLISGQSINVKYKHW